MKLLLLVCLFGLVSLAAAGSKTYPRGCIYIMGQCREECPVGTHAYTTACTQKMPEATCDEPYPELEDGLLCDYSACYCDPPTVRDRASKKCVALDQCPNKRGY